MLILLNKMLNYKLPGPIDSFMEKLKAHVAVSDSKNWITATADDYAIWIKETHKGVVIVKRFLRNQFKICVTFSMQGSDAVARVSIRPHGINLIISALLLIFIAFFSIQLLIGGAILIYLMNFIAIAIESLWVGNLFEKKLLR